MTRGNQREIDRSRAQKRATDNKKGEKTDYHKNKDKHAEMMREKQKIHNEK